MKSILVILLTCVTLQVKAQTHIIGIKGGLTWSNVSSSFLEQTSYKIGVSNGLTYEYLLKKRFSMGT